MFNWIRAWISGDPYKKTATIEDLRKLQKFELSGQKILQKQIAIHDEQLERLQARVLKIEQGGE